MKGRANAPTCYDVVVVGAGLAGSTVAATLADAGWQVLLVERDEFPRHKVCGEFISSEAQNTLHNVGLYAEVAALRPVPLRATEITSATGKVLRRPLPGVAWGLSRYALDAALAAAAVTRGAELWTKSSAIEMTQAMTAAKSQATHQVTLQVRRQGQPITVQAHTAILAYGRAGSTGLTSSLTTPAEDKGANAKQRYVGVKCHYASVARAQQVELFLFPGGYAGLNPVEDGHANLCLLASYAAFAQAGRSVAGMLAAAAAGNPALAARLEGATPLQETACVVANVDTYNVTQPWTQSARLGDSAVMLPPLCGDGMAMALRSAELCAPLADDYLRGRLTMNAWARDYHRQWQQEFGTRIRTGRLVQRLLNRPWLADCLLQIGNLSPTLADYLIKSTRGKVPLASSLH